MMRALLRSEWTKLRTVPAWVIALLVAAGAVIMFGVLPGRQGSCGRHGPGSDCVATVGPGGEQVTDRFFFLRHSLADGTLTVRVSELTGTVPDVRGTDHPGLAPWAKAGLIIKNGTAAGSPYAAVMLTGSHGVRMQYDFTHDVAGPAGARWLRLTRAGETVTGSASVDGVTWTTIGTVRLRGLPATVQAGLFVASPGWTQSVHSGVLSGASGGPTTATAVFTGADPAGPWTTSGNGAASTDGDRLTVTGTGDIAPAVPGASGVGITIAETLIGTFIGLIAVIVVGARFATDEYRRGLIRTTLAATPHRGRLLAAKAIVVGAATFVAGVVGAAPTVEIGQRVLRANGVYVWPASGLTEARVIVGTGLLMAVAAVLALALGAVVRRAAATVAAALVAIVLPYLLAMSVLPTAAGAWLLRVTPAAAFAVQQSAPVYHQVQNLYLPNDGYYPLPGWGGLAVLCGWAAAALVAATVLLRRRDA